MYTHTEIWRGIDRLASSMGYSPSGLAKKAGLDPTSFNKSKRISPDGKPRWPSTESISKILSVTDMTMMDFFAMTGKKETESDHVALKTKDGKVFNGTLIRQSDKKVALEVDGREKGFPRANIEWMARVFWES